MRKLIGRVADYFGLKQEGIKIYESLYRKMRTVQMYILYPFDYWYKKHHPIKMMSIEETIQYVLSHNCSVSRYGDGEFNMISNSSIGFQSADSKLIEKLRLYVQADFPPEKCLVCLPGFFGFENDYEPTTKKFWYRILVHTRKIWYGYLNQSYQYGNADITRCYIELADRTKAKGYFELVKKIWDKKSIVIVEGEKSRLGVGTDLFSNTKNIQRILCPATNAFSIYDEIIEYIDSNIATDEMVLLALGPTATIMAVDLTEKGYQAVDIGNIDKEYEWCIANASQKTRNPLKFSMEIENATQVEDCLDEEYLNQIILNFNANS